MSDLTHQRKLIELDGWIIMLMLIPPILLQASQFIELYNRRGELGLTELTVTVTLAEAAITLLVTFLPYALLALAIYSKYKGVLISVAASFLLLFLALGFDGYRLSALGYVDSVKVGSDIYLIENLLSLFNGAEVLLVVLSFSGAVVAAIKMNVKSARLYWMLAAINYLITIIWVASYLMLQRYETKILLFGLATVFACVMHYFAQRRHVRLAF